MEYEVESFSEFVDVLNKVLKEEKKEEEKEKNVINPLENAVLCKKLNYAEKRLIEKSFAELGNKYKYFYRGQYQFDWELEPSAFREKYGQNENEFYKYALQKYHLQLDDLSYFNQLTQIAHFGGPTRLLDITENPLVALYMATRIEETQKKKSANKRDHAVYVFRIPNGMISTASSDKVMLLSALATRTSIEMEGLVEATKEFIKETNNSECMNSSNEYVKQLNEYAFPKLVHEVKKKCPAFENLIEPQDLIIPRVIIAPKIGQRIIAQSSAFFLPGIELYPDSRRDALVLQKKPIEFQEHLSFTCDILNCFVVGKIKIKDDGKTDFKEMLDLFQIKEEKMFPEMDMSFRAFKREIENMCHKKSK